MGRHRHLLSQITMFSKTNLNLVRKYMITYKTWLIICQTLLIYLLLFHSVIGALDIYLGTCREFTLVLLELISTGKDHVLLILPLLQILEIMSVSMGIIKLQVIRSVLTISINISTCPRLSQNMCWCRILIFNIFSN